ncbi:PilX N-terminal domain-containing pilus assembly protein [Microbulbifer sp. SSSA008]|uniref:pilus assembly PilX family protein n=1 Tax=Microbulbifer sp. SSSA008 TaxID=3243380 RepID=UPI0040394701
MKKRLYVKSLQKQGGATLLVGLVILLLMTFIGLAAIRGSGMQELMAGNMRDRQLALQAAEAALRVAEARLDSASESEDEITTLFDGSTTGVGEQMDGSSASEFWLVYDWEGASVSTALGLKGVASQPVYVVERIEGTAWNANDGGAIDFASSADDEAPQYYRITSRGVGGTDSAVVILHSTSDP